jgi:hypothetical protein
MFISLTLILVLALILVFVDLVRSDFKSKTAWAVILIDLVLLIERGLRLPAD